MNSSVNHDEVIGLIHVRGDEPGFARKRTGKGFIYFDENGNKITAPQVLNRIKKIGIPPMWRDVWICNSPWGYLQATGYDAKGRKQYLYHEEWKEYQQSFKFQKLKEFGYALPSIREKIDKDMNRKGWPREKVIALIIGILDETYIRIGNRQYAEMNGTYGLTTLRMKNLEIAGKEVIFTYKGKSNKYRTVKIKNSRFKRLIRECSELKGYEVFRFINDERKREPVHSNDVNTYLKEITGEDFTSKNFRTWGGTVLAIRKYPEAKERVSANKLLKLKRAIIREVAAELNNTLAVCEKYYIHPAVLEALLTENFNPDEYDISHLPEKLSPEEKVALAIIENFNAALFAA